MNLLVLSWNYIIENRLNTLLNTLLLSFGIGIIVVLLLVGQQLEQKFSNNTRGVDLVVGAKGSPLQLILCNIFHIDFPTGNIPLEEAIGVANNKRLIKNAIPLSLGDSYKTIRIVGTTHGYTELYGAQVAEGKLWKQTLDVTLGAQAAKTLGLAVGDTFKGQHGLTEGAHDHDDHEYQVVGILESSNTALDNLILTNIESVWVMHEKEEEHTDGHLEHEAEAMVETPLGFSVAGEIGDKEITSLLLQYRSPMAAVQLPRMINSRTSLQAASPAFEMSRLLTIIGVGVDVIQGFALLIIFIAGLSVFIALYNSLKERKYDLAMMRAMGASRVTILLHIVLEGVIITFLGGLLGFVLGHGTVELIGQMAGETSQAAPTGLVFLQEELFIVVISFALGLLASLIPAINAYRTDISKVLAKG